MPTLDERVAFLEGKVEEHSRGVDELRALVIQLDAKVDRRIDGLDGRFEAIDRRFEAVDRRFEAVDRRFADLDSQITALDRKVSRQFLWTMGVLTTMLVSLIGTLLGVVLTPG